jgi:hypothetical protein
MRGFITNPASGLQKHRDTIERLPRKCQRDLNG